MAVTLTIADRFLLEKGKGTINFISDVFKAVLMKPAFSFDQATDGEYGDVSANEIDAGHGYVQDDITLSVDSAWAVATNTASIAWNNVTVTVTGEAIADFAGVIIYDSTHASDVIVGYIDLGETVSLADGMSFVLTDLGYDSEQGA